MVEPLIIAMVIVCALMGVTFTLVMGARAIQDHRSRPGRPRRP